MKEEEKDRFDYANFEKEAIENLKNGTSPQTKLSIKP